MAWIETIDDTSAEGALARQYAARKKAAGRVYRIVALHSLDPGALRASMRLYEEVMKADKTLSRIQREMIAVVVSRANDCFY